MLEDYVRAKQKKSSVARALCAGVLLLSAVLLRVFWPHSAKTVRAWVFGDGAVNEAVAAFYGTAAEGAPLPDAIEAMCLALEGT